MEVGSLSLRTIYFLSFVVASIFSNSNAHTRPSSPSPPSSSFSRLPSPSLFSQSSLPSSFPSSPSSFLPSLSPPPPPPSLFSPSTLPPSFPSPPSLFFPSPPPPPSLFSPSTLPPSFPSPPSLFFPSPSPPPPPSLFSPSTLPPSFPSPPSLFPSPSPPSLFPSLPSPFSPTSSPSSFSPQPSLSTPPSAPNVTSPSLLSIQGSNDHSTTRTIIIVVVAIISVIILTVGICIIFILRNLKHKTPLPNFQNVALGDATDEISSVETIQFDFETIKVATNDFSDENKLGHGGFGAVYKGKQPNGQHIAVKRLANNSQQGDIEFKNEVLLVVKLQHRNLVRLLGFCLQGKERLLIYEFVQNGSLDHFIFDFAKRMILDWDKRYKIINGIARGLLYLHEDSRLRIIHRDIKASNILLDDKMNPKIADFGMARLFEVDGSQGSTTRIVGTYGYMAPEYILHGQFSVKSDVFSFGILVLEILSGQKSNSFCNGENIEDVSNFAWRNWRAGTPINVIDSTLSAGSRIEMLRCIHIGLLCVQESVVYRPTMASVVMMLNSSSVTLPIPNRPAFLMNGTTNGFNSMTKSNGTDHFETASVLLLGE